MTEPIDSRPDTYAHIHRVQELLSGAVSSLVRRMLHHDASKLEEPELSGFNEWTPKLASLTYGTDDYKAALVGMRPFLEHHYAHGSHHPEHYGDGIRGMTLLDLVEMLCDWRAATERHANNIGLISSIEKNQQRFGYSDELKGILLNTAEELGLA